MRLDVDLDPLQPGRRGVSDPAIVIPAHRHQPLADIGAGRHRHPQAQRGILMHIAPVGAKQKPPLGFAEGCEIAHHAVAHPVRHTPRARRQLRRQQLQQRRLARAGFADDRQHLAGIERKGHVAAGRQPAIGFCSGPRPPAAADRCPARRFHAQPCGLSLCGAALRCRDAPRLAGLAIVGVGADEHPACPWSSVTISSR